MFGISYREAENQFLQRYSWRKNLITTKWRVILTASEIFYWLYESEHFQLVRLCLCLLILPKKDFNVQPTHCYVFALVKYILLLRFNILFYILVYLSSNTKLKNFSVTERNFEIMISNYITLCIDNGFVFPSSKVLELFTLKLRDFCIVISCILVY